MAVSNALLSAVKKSMRVTHDQLDTDFEAKINAALAEMARVGINIPDPVNVDADFLIVTGCEMYVKWLDNYEQRAEEHRRAFRQIRDSLAMSSGYMVEEADV